MTFYTLSLILHVAAGTVALASFWTAGLMRKGTPKHRLIGKIYLIAMLTVIASGLPLVFNALDQGLLVKALFLAYLLLIVAMACWNSWRAIRDKRDRSRYYGPVYWTFVLASAVCGVGISALGWQFEVPILTGFGGIGVVTMIGGLRGWRRSASDPKWWLKEHYGAMIGNGVATHIAFFGIGLRSALPMIDPQTLQLFAWFTPLAGAVVATWWLGRKYGGGPAPRVQTSPSLNQPSPVPR